MTQNKSWRKRKENENSVNASVDIQRVFFLKMLEKILKIYKGKIGVSKDLRIFVGPLMVPGCSITFSLLQVEILRKTGTNMQHYR